MLAPDHLPEVWVECRGIGASFGFNRNERIKDYLSSQALILLFIDVVSHGGNLLLNIGPTGAGQIPVFMRQRLLDIGRWLKINGAAIYGARRHTLASQWSDGKRMDINPRLLDEPMTEPIAERNYLPENFDILKLTVNPDAGQAVKEIMCTGKDDSVYAITPLVPKKELKVQSVVPSQATWVALVRTRRQLNWNCHNGIMTIQAPAELVLELPFQHAYTFKITGVE